LNLACGDNIKLGWVNVDLFDPTPVDLRLDLTEPLPFADGSVRTIYCEHFFEHLDFPKHARGFLREALRVLEPGGVLSIGVPDTQWPLQCYVTGDDSYFRFGRAIWGHPEWCNTPLHQINFHFRQLNEHRYAYDELTLAQVLHEEGFVQPKRREFDPALDSELRRVGTLYMDAVRPAPQPSGAA
jgi:predicted SAM-dependent methyltransferase